MRKNHNPVKKLPLFKRNYKNLLEDLKEKNVLTIEEM